MISNQFQKVRVKLLIKKITMNIKFPCSLTVQVKSDSTYDLRKAYQIRAGECIINESLEVDVQTADSTLKNRPEEKKITLNVYMISLSGKVSAGFTSISLHNKEISSSIENVQFLEKCPDKGAKIYYSYSIEVLRNKSDRLDKTLINQLRSVERKDSDTSQIKKRTTFNSMQLPQTTRNSFEEKYYRNPRRTPDNSSQVHLTESKVEQVVAVAKPKGVEANFSMNQYKSRSKSKNKIKPANNFSSKNILSPPAPSHVPITSAPLSNRITDANEDENEVELMRLKEKLRNAEKAQRNTAQVMKEIRQQSEKRKNKIIYLESNKQQLEESMKQKEERLKKNERVIKQLTEQSEEHFNQIKSLKSQLDLRESISKQQAKKLQQKYKFSQSQRQKITEQYNKILKNYEQNEKKFQSILKQKQRGIYDEKQKTAKRIEQLNSCILQKESEIKDFGLQLEELTKEHQILNSKYSQIQQLNQNLQNQLEEILLKNKTLTQSVKHFEAEIDIYKSQEAQRQQIKKKFNESTHVNNQLQEKLSKNEKIIRSLEEKIKQLEEDNSKKTAERNQISQKLNALKKNYDNLKMNQEMKSKQSESLMQLHSTASNKIVDLKSKLQFEKKTMEEIQKEYESKYGSVMIEKENLEAEAEELRWELEKKHSMLQELNNQIRIFNDKNYSLNEELIEKSQKIKKLQESIKQYQSSCDFLNSSIAQSDVKKKEMGNLIKDLTNSNSELKKKSERLDKQLFDAKERIKILQANTKERNSDYEKRLKEKDQNLQAKQAKINTLEAQLKQALDDSSSQKQQLSNFNQEVLHLKQIILANKKESDNQENLIIKLRDSQNEVKRLISLKDQQIIKKNKQIEEIGKKMNKIIEESALQYSSLSASIQNYLAQMINSEEEIKWTPPSSTNSNLIKIGQLQIESIQRHNSIISKNRVRYSQLAAEKENVQYSLSKVGVQLQEVRHHYEQQLIKQKEKLKQLQSSYLLLQQEEKETLVKYDQLQIQLSKETEALKIQVAKSSEEKLQLQSQISIVLSQYESVKEECRELESKLLNFKNQQLKDKNTLQSKYLNLTENHESELEQYKTYILELEKKIHFSEKECKDRLEIIKKYEQEMHSINYEKDKKDGKIQDYQQKASQYQNEIKKLSLQLKEKQRDLKKINDSFEQLSHICQDEKEKSQDLLYKNQELNNIIIDLSKDVDKGKEENEALKQRNQQTESSYKAKIEYMKNQLQKQASEVKDLKEKLIVSNSEAELKKFMNKQLETSLAFEREQKQQLKAEIEKKKSQILSLIESSNNLAFKNKQLQNLLSEADIEKERLLSSIQKHKNTILQLRKIGDEVTLLNERASQLQRQLQKSKDEKIQLESYYERQISQMRGSLKETKRLESSKISREQQLRKKVKVLEKLMDTDNLELNAIRKKILQEMEKEKRDYLSKNDYLESKMSQAEEQLESLKLRYKKQLDRITKQIQSLEEENNSKDFIIKNQQYELDNTQYKLSEVLQEKSQLEKQLEKEKNKNKSTQETFEKENEELKLKIKRIQQEESKQAIESLQKKIMKSKNKRVETNGNQFERVIMNSDYREFEDILSEVLREKNRI